MAIPPSVPTPAQPRPGKRCHPLTPSRAPPSHCDRRAGIPTTPAPGHRKGRGPSVRPDWRFPEKQEAVDSPGHRRDGAQRNDAGGTPRFRFHVRTRISVAPAEALPRAEGATQRPALTSRPAPQPRVPCWPRFAGLSGSAGRDPLREFARLRIGPAAAGRARSGSCERDTPGRRSRRPTDRRCGEARVWLIARLLRFRARDLSWQAVSGCRRTTRESQRFADERGEVRRCRRVTTWPRL